MSFIFRRKGPAPGLLLLPFINIFLRDAKRDQNMVLKNMYLKFEEKRKSGGAFQGRGPVTKLCLHHMKILCAPLVIFTLSFDTFANYKTNRITYTRQLLIEFLRSFRADRNFPSLHRNVSISGNGIFGPASPVYMSQSLRTFCLSKYFALNGFFSCSCKRGLNIKTLKFAGSEPRLVVDAGVYSQCGGAGAVLVMDFEGKLQL